MKFSPAKVIGSIFIVIVGFMAFSCSDFSPAIVSVVPTVVFDYSDSDSNPKTHLSLFVALQKDAQRSEKLVVRKNGSDMEWTDFHPIIFKNGGKNYVCAKNIFPYYRNRIEPGDYSLTFSDAAGNEISSNFSVSFENALLKTKQNDVKSLLGDFDENLAIYEEDGTLIFFGKRKNSWKKNADILSKYKTAFEKRLCYSKQNNSVLVMFAPEKIVKE